MNGKVLLFFYLLTFLIFYIFESNIFYIFFNLEEGQILMSRKVLLFILNLSFGFVV